MENLKIYDKPKKYRIRQNSGTALVFCEGKGMTDSVGIRMFGVIETGFGSFLDASWSIGGKYSPLTVGDSPLDLMELVE